MEFTRGITAEIRTGDYHKFIVTLDADDLASLVSECWPGTQVSDLTVRERFRLLEYEAEAMLRVSFQEMVQEGALTEEFKASYRKLITGKEKLVAEVKGRLGK